MVQAAETNPFTHGDCVKFLQDRGESKEDAQFICKEHFFFNQGQCIQASRAGETHLTEEQCKERFPNRNSPK